MGAEKVGFSFEFGLKGDKEVKSAMQELFHLMASGGTTAEVLTRAIGSAGGMFNLGKLSGPLGLAGTAMAAFAIAGERAGETLRQTRFELDRLSRVDTSALTDSGLSSDESAVTSRFADLGLEAGNAFTNSWDNRVKNFRAGLHTIVWDATASIGNRLTGGQLPSAEQLSGQAKDATKRLQDDIATGDERVKIAEKVQQDIFKIQQQGRDDIAQLYGRHYLPPELMGSAKYADDLINGERVGNPVIRNGVLPESYQGQQRLMDIRQNLDRSNEASLTPLLRLEKQKLAGIQAAPAPYYPGTNILDPSAKNENIRATEAKINDLLAQQANYRQDALEIEQHRRDIQREVARNQNYGSYRTLGLGGVGYQDRGVPQGHGLNAISGALGGHRGRVNAGVFEMSQPGAFSDGSLMKVQTETLQDINKRIGKIGIPTIQN